MVCVTSPRLYNLYAIHRQLSLLQFTNKDTKPVSGHALLEFLKCNKHKGRGPDLLVFTWKSSWSYPPVHSTSWAFTASVQATQHADTALEGLNSNAIAHLSSGPHPLWNLITRHSSLHQSPASLCLPPFSLLSTLHRIPNSSHMVLMF